MKDLNRVLMKEAEPIIGELKELKEVKAIVFYGSVGYGYSDELSDIDIAIFCTEKPGKKTSKKFSKDLGINVIKGIFSQGFVWKGREWTLWPEKISDMEYYMSEFVNRKIDWWEQKITNLLHKSITVWDPEGLIKKLTKKVRTYPLWLKKTNLEKLNFAANRLEKIERGIKRKNSALILDSLNQIVNTFIRVTYALNNEFYPGSEWFSKDAKKFRVLPKNCVKRIEELSSFGTGAEEKIELIKEMLKNLMMLSKKQMPEIVFHRDIDGSLIETNNE